jgi:phospholipid-binding lipoprotein MlaA
LKVALAIGIVEDAAAAPSALAEPPEEFVILTASPRRRPVMRRAGLAGLLLATLLAGCATPPSDPALRAAFEQTNDPLEPLNRRILDVNQFIDTIVLRPVAKAYVTVIPDDGRKAIHNVLDNMKEPTLAFNNLLQGEFTRARISVGRFIVNSTVGFAGAVDAAEMSGLARQKADFGQTLYVWGVPSGPYLILPLLGPSNPRDAIGGGVDSYADPATILAKNDAIQDLITERFVVGGVDERAKYLDVLDDLQKNAIDYYAQLRSLSQQNRAAELRHGAAPKTAPDLYTDPGK